MTHRVRLPLLLKRYRPDGPPAATCTQPFAVTSTTAGFRAAYDPNGNMVWRVEVAGTQRITYLQEYDAENRLAVVTHTVTGAVVCFVYDGDGHRILRIGPEGTTVTLGDSYEQRGSTVRKYYYAGGGRVGMREGGALYFLHGDHLGSATLTTDANGNWVGEARYTPYGEMRRDYPRGAIPTDRRYTGQRQEGFGLYDYGARMYSPSLARFVSADVFVPDPTNPHSLNRYAYALNSPLVYIDDGGHAPILPLLIAGGVVVLKVVDYGWTAYDVYQSGQVLANPLATDEDKLIAGFNIVLSMGLEVAEPEDWLPASLPLDDLARRGVVRGLREAIQEGGLRAGVRFVRETAGEAAPQVIRHLYDQGLFRDIRSADEWGDILSEVRQGADLEVHHLIEQRFAARLGIREGDIPAVVLDRAFHQQEVTARLFRELPTNPRRLFEPQEIWNAYKTVYGTGPKGLNRLDWLEAVWPYFKRLGVQR